MTLKEMFDFMKNVDLLSFRKLDFKHNKYLRNYEFSNIRLTVCDLQ